MVNNREKKSFGFAQKIRDLLRRLAGLTFMFPVQAFWNPLRGEIPLVQIFMNNGPNPLT